jgi:RNA polymerase sigma factor (sigma-70 family)
MPAAAFRRPYRSDWGRIVATLIRIVGDFDVAEEAAQEAFTAALDHWRDAGVPEFPRAWIITTARNKAIDRIRRQARFESKLESYGAELTAVVDEPDYNFDGIEDDRLRLIFTCCHPAVALDAQVPLTLRTLCGLDTDEIARAFLVPAPTMAQRLVRAKRRSGTRAFRTECLTEPRCPSGSTPSDGDLPGFQRRLRGDRATRSSALIFEAISRAGAALMAPQPP